VTADVLRRKLDAAILAEAWEAVKVIRQRIVEERGAGRKSSTSLVDEAGRDGWGLVERLTSCVQVLPSGRGYQ
jgi:hypothetical protein